MKKIILTCLCVVMVIGFTGCNNKKTNEDTTNKNIISKDASKFKDEYESYNGKKNSSGVEYRNITIADDNPFVYISADEIVKKIENKETFYLYIGDKQCPWCRSSIESAIKIAKNNKIDKIYYINIWDDDHNEILRDKYSLNDNGKLTLEIEGTPAYHKLLEKFDTVLSDYTLTSKDGKKIEVGEKRIFAPNYFYVKNGKVERFVSGTSDLQKTSNAELTKEILEDQEGQFNKLFNK